MLKCNQNTRANKMSRAKRVRGRERAREWETNSNACTHYFHVVTFYLRTKSNQIYVGTYTVTNRKVELRKLVGIIPKIGCGFYEVFYGVCAREHPLRFRPLWFQLNENVYIQMNADLLEWNRLGARRLSVWLCRKSFLRFEEWKQTGALNDIMEIHVWICESNACVGIKAIVMGKTL